MIFKLSCQLLRAVASMRWALPLAMIVCLTCGPQETIAAMLDKAACSALVQEQVNFKALDVDKLMEKGPEWAIANLSPGDLSIVRRSIEVDEQLKFRCTSPGALVKLQGPVDDEEATAAKTGTETGVDGKKPKDPAEASSGDDAAAPKAKSGKLPKALSAKARAQAAKSAPNKTTPD